MTKHRHSVLVIEDHADGLEVMAALIALDGFDVVGVPSAEEALARCRDGLTCCLIILDWTLPGMSGEQFYQALTSDPRLADVPVLVLTGNPKGAARARELGAEHVELKPIDPDALIAIIEKHCTRSAA